MEEKRNDPTTLEKRKEFVMSLKLEGILFNMNCIFIDEAGFNANMIKDRARSKAGKPAFIMYYKQKENQEYHYFVCFICSRC